jgi:hypothetical protein
MFCELMSSNVLECFADIVDSPGFTGVIDTGEESSAVSLTLGAALPLSLTLVRNPEWCN